MGPRGLGPKSIKITKSYENHYNHAFLTTWKRCASKFYEGSTDLKLQIIDMNFWEQTRCLEKCEKVLKLVQFWVRAVCLTTRLRRAIGCLQVLVLCCGSPSGFFFRQKNLSENLIMRIYKKKVHLCVFLRKLIKYVPSPPTHHPGSPPSQVAF